MGTSATNPGSNGKNPLIPSWLNPPDFEPLPTSGDQSFPDDGVNGDDNTKPPLPTPAEGDRYRISRSNFSRFARSGGEDQGALRRAAGNYVRTSIGGSNNALRRIAPSRFTAGNVLGLFRGLERDGIQETLRRLDLDFLSGHSIQDIFTGFTEVVCKDGGQIDDAIARDAWLETISKLDQFGIDNLNAMREEQVRGLFLSFISHSIKALLYQEIGVNGFKFSNNLDNIENFDNKFGDYLERSVRDSFSGDLSTLSNMSDIDIRNVVDKTYLEAWELLQMLGDQER